MAFLSFFLHYVCDFFRFTFRHSFLPSFHIPSVLLFITWHFVGLFLLSITFCWPFLPCLHIPSSYTYSALHFVGCSLLPFVFHLPFLASLRTSLASSSFVSLFDCHFLRLLVLSHLLTHFAFHRLFLHSFHIPSVFSFITWHFVGLFLVRFTFRRPFLPCLRIRRPLLTPLCISSAFPSIMSHSVGLFFHHFAFRWPLPPSLLISLAVFSFPSHTTVFLVLLILPGPRLPLAHRITMHG